MFLPSAALRTPPRLCGFKAMFLSGGEAVCAGGILSVQWK